MVPSVMGSATVLGGEAMNLSRMDIDVLIDTDNSGGDTETALGSAWALQYAASAPASSATYSTASSGTAEAVKKAKRSRNMESDTMSSSLYKQPVGAIEGLETARMGRFTLRFSVPVLEEAFEQEVAARGVRQTAVFLCVNWVALSLLAVMDVIGDETPSRKASLLAARFVVGSFLCLAPAASLLYGPRRFLTPRVMKVGSLTIAVALSALMVGLALANRSVYDDVYCSFGVLFILVTGVFLALPVLHFRVAVAVGVAILVVFFGLLFAGVFSGTMSQFSFGLGGVILLIACKRIFETEMRRSILLEAVRVEQERQLVLQRDVSQQLVHNILPRSVANMLAAEPGTDTARYFPSVTALTMDVVSFTMLSSEMSALSVVAMLNALFSKFDTLVRVLGVEKICTIGDAYVAASGLPDPCLDHARRMIMLGVGMLNVTSKVRAHTADARKRGRPIAIRVGIHTGSCVAGILGGKIRFKYDIYGDAMHVAGALEQGGVPMALHVSKATVEQVDMADIARRHRGVVEVRESPLRVHVAGRDEELVTYLVKFPEISAETNRSVASLADGAAGKPSISRRSTRLSMRGQLDAAPLEEGTEGGAEDEEGAAGGDESGDGESGGALLE
eukprot:Opistho-1_new@104902